MDTVYVTGLPTNITEQLICEKFGSIGVIKVIPAFILLLNLVYIGTNKTNHCCYMKIDKKKGGPRVHIYLDKQTQEPKGDATVSYDDPQAASAAVNW